MTSSLPETTQARGGYGQVRTQRAVTPTPSYVGTTTQEISSSPTYAEESLEVIEVTESSASDAVMEENASDMPSTQNSKSPRSSSPPHSIGVVEKGSVVSASESDSKSASVSASEWAPESEAAAKPRSRPKAKSYSPKGENADQVEHKKEASHKSSSIPRTLLMYR
jgi:hypothetical protein